MKKENVTGIIVAGGHSRRFGEPKAVAMWEGQTFLSYSIRAMQDVADQIVVVSHLPEVPLDGAIVIEDSVEYKGQGPLAGILTGMETIQTNWYMVLPCDVPLITQKVVMKIIQNVQENEEIDAVVPLINGQRQPLIALYHYRVKEKIAYQLRNHKYSMWELLSLCTARYVTEKELEIEAVSFSNINTKKEFENLVRFQQVTRE